MEENFKNILNRKHIIRGAILFFMFTFIGLLISTLWKGSRDIVKVPKSLDLRFLAVMFLLMFLDWVLMGYRIFIFASKMPERIGFWNCFRANLAGTFVTTITPAQTAGWAGQLYILYRSGLPLASGMTITIITFLSTLLLFLFPGLFVIVFLPKLYMGKMAFLINYCFIMFLFVFAGTILLLLKPDFILGILSKFSSPRLIKFNHHVYKFFQNVMIKLERLNSEYKDTITFFFKHQKGTFLLCVFVTFIIYFNRFLIAYVIARALDRGVVFWDVILVQVPLTFIWYFSPTPGASGISEFSATFFMHSIMRQGSSLFFAPIWRFSNTYLELLVGGFIMVAQLRRDVIRNVKPQIDR